MIRMIAKDEMIKIDDIEQLKKLAKQIGSDEKIRFTYPRYKMIPRVQELLKINDLAIVYNNGCWGFGSYETHKGLGKKLVTIDDLYDNTKAKKMVNDMFKNYERSEKAKRSDIFINDLLKGFTKN